MEKLTFSAVDKDNWGENQVATDIEHYNKKLTSIVLFPNSIKPKHIYLVIPLIFEYYKYIFRVKITNKMCSMRSYI